MFYADLDETDSERDVIRRRRAHIALELQETMQAWAGGVFGLIPALIAVAVSQFILPPSHGWRPVQQEVRVVVRLQKLHSATLLVHSGSISEVHNAGDRLVGHRFHDFDDGASNQPLHSGE